MLWKISGDNDFWGKVMKHRLVLAAGAALLLASVTGCTGSFDAGPAPSGGAIDFGYVDPGPGPSTPLPASIDAPTLEGTTLWTGTGQPGASLEGSFDATGRAIFVGLNCQGDGVVTVTLSEGSSYTMPCVAGSMTPYGNEDQTAHGAVTIKISASGDVVWGAAVAAMALDVPTGS
jgi:hypothetical protein